QAEDGIRDFHVTGVQTCALPISKTTIEEIANNPSRYPVIETNAENCYLTYPGAAPYWEPWYTTGYTGDKRVDNFGISDIFIDHLLEMEDPRIGKVANKANDGQYRGYQNGAASTPTPLTSISFI